MIIPNLNVNIPWKPKEQLKKNRPIIKLLNLTLFTIGLLLDLIDEINILKNLVTLDLTNMII